MPRVNLNSLALFDAAARFGSFKRAAHELNLTQGAVAQQVRNLEKQTQTQLFHRLPQGLSLTEEGQSFHATIAPALRQIEHGMRALKPPSQSVTLSVPPSLASKWLVPRISDFADKHPSIALHIHASEKLTDFTADLVDVAIRQGPPPERDGLKTNELAPLDLQACAAPSFTTKSFGALRDFQGEKLIDDGHNRWKSLLKDDGLPQPKALLSFNQTALAIDAAVNGQGIALAPRLLLKDALDQGILRVLWTPPHNTEAFHLLHPGGRHPARETVLSWLQEAVGT